MSTAGMTQTIPQGVEYVRILPEIVLSLFGMAIMVLEPLVDEHRSPAWDSGAWSRWMGSAPSSTC